MVNQVESEVLIVDNGQTSDGGADARYADILQLRKAGGISVKLAAKLILRLDRTIADADVRKSSTAIKIGKNQSKRAN